MSSPLRTVLDREEYVEQAHFFRTYRDRLAENLPAQEIMTDISEELLATTNLPKAIEFLKGELVLNGKMSTGMAQLPHYFSPFQTYVMACAEDDNSRFDISVALHILQKMAEYMQDEPTPRGLFIYQFECLTRNRLGYDAGMVAIANDPLFDEDWTEWLSKMRFQLGERDFTEFVYFRSEKFVEDHRKLKRDPNYQPSYPLFFGNQEGRIAKANQGKDLLYMFSALQRQLNYPKVPYIKQNKKKTNIHPEVENRLKQLEQRLQIIESETKGDFDLSAYYESGEGKRVSLED